MQRCQCNGQVRCSGCGGVVPAAKRGPAKARSGLGRMKPTSAELNQRTRALRAELIALAGSYCERCDWTMPAAFGHMHHLKGGNGRRRQEQNITNVAWICVGCHEELHRSPELNRAFASEIEKKRQGQSRSSAGRQP